MTTDHRYDDRSSEHEDADDEPMPGYKIKDDFCMQ